jgi:hypothetical protein
MALRRVATTRKAEKGYAVLVETGKEAYLLTADDLLTYDSAEKAKIELERQVSASKETLPPLFVHKNRDGSLALATGAAPDVWPEDAPRDTLTGIEITEQ